MLLTIVYTNNMYKRALLILLLFISLNVNAHSVAFLGVQFINDHQEYVPTSDAEKARLLQLEEVFKEKLVQSGEYSFVQIPADFKQKIAKGQTIGSCGGCEIQYGNELNSQYVAWIVVQKVSNLILNINVYMTDVNTKKLIFVKSADIRGNTDESWRRGLVYIIVNYLLHKNHSH